jgi:hypothetical protein
MIKLLSLNTKLNNSELIRFTHFIISCMVNPIFNHPLIQKLLASVKELVAKMEAAVDAAPHLAQAADVEAVRKQLEDTLALLITQTEVVINDTDLTDEERVALAQGAGFTLRQYGKRTKQRFMVENGATAGEIIVTMEGNKKAYEVLYTDDVVNFNNKQTVVSAVSVATINGLKIDTKYAVFYRAHGPNTEKVVEGPLFITVR